VALNERMLRFVDAVFGGAEYWKAAELAGYTGSRATLQVTGSRLMAKPEIRAALEARGWKAKGRAQRSKRAKRSRKSGPSSRATAAASIAEPSDELGVLNAIIGDASSRPLERMRALERRRELEEEKERTSSSASPAGTLARQTVVWVNNPRGPAPAEWVLHGLLQLEASMRREVIAAALASLEADAGPTRNLWLTLADGIAGKVARLERLAGEIADLDVRRYVLELVLADPHAPPAVRVRARQLIGAMA
jgi:hypothetical protein